MVEGADDDNAVGRILGRIRFSADGAEWSGDGMASSWEGSEVVIPPPPPRRAMRCAPSELGAVLGLTVRGGYG